MSDASLISTDVDYDRDGKQFGRLAVPQSTNSAGWAQYFVPIVVVRHGDGPTVALFGGNHGDEFEGPVALSKLARIIEPGDVRGRLIIVPMLNRPAIEAGTRLSPLDGANMNRAFPGSARGTITGMIAHYVANEILPQADVVIDVHSGGSSLHMLPSVNMHRVENPTQMRRMFEAAAAWGAPYCFVYRDVAGEGLLPTLAEAMGKVTLGTEMGSRSQFGVETLRITEDGVRNVLNWAGVLKMGVTADSSPMKYVAADDLRDYVMAPCSGIFEPCFELEQRVDAGETLGWIHDTERLEKPPEPVHAETSGLLFARRAIPLTKQGECLATLVREFEP